MDINIIKWDEGMAVRCFSKYKKPDNQDKQKNANGKNGPLQQDIEQLPIETTESAENEEGEKVIKNVTAANEDVVKESVVQNNDVTVTYSEDSDFDQWENFRRALTY